MGNFDKLGLNLDILHAKGMEAAIALHDQTHSLPYHVKARIMKEKEKKEKTEGVGRKSLSDAITPKGNKSMQLSITAQGFLAKQKTAAKRAAFLALGKLAIDTIRVKLPEEVGVLGPIAVAQLLAAVPATNATVQEMQEAALAYAMTVTVQELKLPQLLQDLTEVADDS